MRGRTFLLGFAIFAGLVLFFVGVVLVVTRLTSTQAPWPGKARIGVVDIEGVISSAEKTNQRLKKLRRSQQVKAIILRINSPGGGVGPSQSIYQEVRRAAQEKPVVASMEGVGASGGYYIAAGADRILANPGTITGSIGVIMEFSDFQGLMDKVGVDSRVIKSGRYKDTGSPFRDMDSAERQLLQGVIDDVHRQFMETVSKGRKLPLEKVKQLADGRIFSGRQAQKAGLVDELGNFQEAVRVAKELADYPGKPRLDFPPPPERSLLDLVMHQMVGAKWQQILPSSSTLGLLYLWPQGA